MHKFWGWLGLSLGRPWIIALLIGAVTTVGLGFGTTKLHDNTGCREDWCHPNCS